MVEVALLAVELAQLMRVFFPRYLLMKYDVFKVKKLFTMQLVQLTSASIHLQVASCYPYWKQESHAKQKIIS